MAGRCRYRQDLPALGPCVLSPGSAREALSKCSRGGAQVRGVYEWQWLHDALNAVARARAEQGDAAAFRLMQQQAMRVGQRRVELRMKMAALEGRSR